MELGQFERADDRLREIASQARATFPIVRPAHLRRSDSLVLMYLQSVFEGVEIPAVGEGLTPADLMEIYGRERENAQEDRVRIRTYPILPFSYVYQIDSSYSQRSL